MLTKPINEIIFEDIENFCNEWAEGVRVEYKRDIEVKKHIPKAVSSFANFLGGILMIGVECDKVQNKVIAINGIPSKNGIEDQIIHCAIKNIYPAVIPAVKIVDIPNTNNIVVVLQVDESVQAPHTIQNTTEVYIRTGNVSYPYKLAEIDRIEYMFKRRENSQVAAQQILNRIEERSQYLIMRQDIIPVTLTLIAQPTFPYRPIISPSTIYELHEQQHTPPKRIDGGVCYFREEELFELNEHGIVCRKKMFPIPFGQREILFGQILFYINDFLKETKNLYEKSEYQGNLDFKVGLRKANKCKLIGNTPDGRNLTDYLSGEPVCLSDLDVVLAKQCLSHDLKNKEGRKDIAAELMWKLLWIFDIPIDKEQLRALFRKQIDSSVE